MYDPTLGRFLQRDPMAIGSDGFGPTNVYSYVLDSPTNGIDPSGLIPFTWNFRGGPFLKIEKGSDGPVTKTYPLENAGKQYGQVTVTAKVKDGLVTIQLKYEAKETGKCPCAGNLGWVQHVTDPISGAWHYDNAAEQPERKDVGDRVIPGRGQASSPGAKPADFPKRPAEGAWKSNPWYGGIGNVTAQLEKDKQYKPLEWTNNPKPQTEISDTPAKGEALAFIDQLVCEATGEILFDYAWIQNVTDTDNKKSYTFFGGRPFYGDEFGKKGTGVIITPAKD